MCGGFFFRVRSAVCLWAVGAARCADPRCLHNPLAVRASREIRDAWIRHSRGRARWVGEYFSMHLIVHRAKLKNSYVIKPHPYASSSMLAPSWSLARPTHHLSKALRQPSAAAHRGRPPSSRAAPRRAGARARRWPRCAPAWGAAAAGAACWSHQGAGSLAGG